MKIKHLLTKTLLVAAGLCLGAGNVWADEINATLDHTAGAQWGSNTGASTVDAEKEHYNNDAASAWAGCAYAKFSYSIPAGHSIVSATLTYSVNQGGKSGRNDIIYYMAKDFDLDWANFAGQTGTDLRNTGNRGGKAVEAAATGGTGDRINLTQDVTNAVRAIYEAGQNYIILQWTGNAGGADLYGKGSATHAPTLVISTTAATLYTATFTETNSLSPTVTIYSDAGMTSTITNGSLADGTTYYFKAVLTGYQDYTGSFTVSGANPSVSFTMTAKAVYSYTVKAVDGSDNNLGTVASGSGYANEEVTYYYPEFVLSGTTLYTKNRNGSNPYWGASGTLDSDNKEFTVTYGNGTIENVVFYKEAEDIEGFTAKTTNNALIRCSAGTGGISTDPVALTTLPAGKYTIFGQVWGTTGLTATVKAGDVTVWELASTGSLVSSTSAEFNLIESTDLTVVTTGGNDNHMLDLIYIVRTGDATTSIPVEIKATGTTFSSAYAIDCDNLPSGVTAYKVTKMTASQVTAVEVSGKVAANTGLILKATAADNYNIPVAATGEAVDGNLLKAAVTATAVEADKAYGLSGGVFKKLEAGDVPAGKAYLLAEDITSAPELTIDFGGATGIADVRSKMADVRSEIYNLAGQRVAQPAKGLYIQNGRKVILK